MEKKKFLGVLFMALFLTQFVSSATTPTNQVVQVPQQQQKSGFFATYFGFLKSPIFWWIVVIFIFIMILLVGVFFLVRWLVKFLKSQQDIYYMLKHDRIKLAKIHSRYNSNHWWRITKNVPIRLIHEENGKAFITSPIGYYRGDSTSHEGNVNIAMNLIGDNQYLIFPKVSLLVIPNYSQIKLPNKNAKGESAPIEIKNIPRSKDIIQYNQGEILLHIESVSKVGQFYVPVLKATNGEIIDLSMPSYQSLRDVVMGDYLYVQTDEFTKVAKKSIDMSPQLRYEIKTKDASSSIDVPSNNTQGGGR